MAWLFQPLLPASAQQSTGGAYSFNAAAAVFDMAGQSVRFSRNYAFAAEPGLYALNGSAIIFDIGGADDSNPISALTLGLTVGL